MVCQGALRVGTGLITLGIPESLNPIMAAKLTEAMTEPLPETKEKTLSLSSHDRIMDLCARKSALAIGPGLSLNTETARLVQRVVRSINIPAVIDEFGNSTEQAYTGWPDRLYLIDAKGRIVYKAKPGPFGFKSDELRAVLGRLVN